MVRVLTQSIACQARMGTRVIMRTDMDSVCRRPGIPGVPRTPSVDAALLMGNVPLTRSAASELALTMGDSMQL